MPHEVNISKLLLSSSLPALAFGLAIAVFSARSAGADEIQTSYSLAAGATSAPNLAPAGNTPVQMTCANNTNGYRGVSQATFLRPYPNQFLQWVGIDIATAAIVSGFSEKLGDHVIYCSWIDKYVEIQINSVSAIQVKNNGPIAVSGVITWLW